MTAEPLDLDALIERAKTWPPMTPAEQREQAKSFAYGNCHIDNPRVTREMVDDFLPPLRAEDYAHEPDALDKTAAVLLATASAVSVATLLSVLYWVR